MKSHFQTREQRHECGRHLSLVLRELAPSLGLNVDDFGSVTIDQLVPVMCKFKGFLTSEHITEIAQKDAQHRFEILNGRIRAKTGHRYPVKIPLPPSMPPELLYHGTSVESLNKIRQQGILQMGKAFVHLSTTRERAFRVGLRKTNEPQIILIKAQKAYEAGIRFWRSGQVSPDGEIYLSDEIPPCFIEETHR